MSKPIFTANDGTRYELVNPEYPDGVSGMHMIKPIQEVEEKLPHKLAFFANKNYVSLYSKENWQLTEKQATALASAIKALVAYVHQPYTSFLPEDSFNFDIKDTVVEARKAMQL